jgi:hypothetical protein
VGAERKGPLVAFIIVAIIAVILLVTSVRSQAAPGWLDRRLPASVVAVGDGMSRIVAQGVVLVHRTSPEHAAADDGVVTASGSDQVIRPTQEHVSSPRPAVVGADPSRHAHPARARAADAGPADPADVDAETDTPGPPGRHLGWGHGHGQAFGHEHGDASEHGHGHLFGHGHGYAHGHTHGHGHSAQTQGHGQHIGWARQWSGGRV